MVRVHGRAPAPAVNSSVRWPHDLPLLLAGVLRLVDQHVVDAEIELVVHPGGIDVAQQRQRLVDEIVVVEQPAALLFLAGSVPAPRRRWCSSAALRSRQATARRRSSSAQMRSCSAAKPLHQRGVLDRLGDDGFARRAFAGAENLQIGGDPFGVRQRREAGEAARLLDVGLVALRQGLRQRRPFRPAQSANAVKYSASILATRRRTDRRRALATAWRARRRRSPAVMIVSALGRSPRARRRETSGRPPRPSPRPARGRARCRARRRLRAAR